MNYERVVKDKARDNLIGHISRELTVEHSVLQDVSDDTLIMTALVALLNKTENVQQVTESTRKLIR